MKTLTLHRENGEARIVAARVEEARGFFPRLLGLMFRGSFGANDGLALTPCSSIHTCFMRFAIDAVCVDACSRVVDAARGLKPWKLFFPKGGPRTIVELPAGTISRCGIREGDVLRWEKAVEIKPPNRARK